MDYELEKHLRDMGVLPSNTYDELAVKSYSPCPTLAKGYFNDPRDPITGEVPF
jgi:hypothetical protein